MSGYTKQIKGETYLDHATGLERRRRLGGGGVDTTSKNVGSKREVWNGTAEKTSGGLTIEKLGKNKRGHIVSVAKYLQGKQRIGQLAQSPFFGRIQDLNAARAGGATNKKKAASPKSAKAPAKSASPSMKIANSYVDDIARLGGVGLGPRGPAMMPMPFQRVGGAAPAPHMSFHQPMPSPYGFSQPLYPTMY